MTRRAETRAGRRRAPGGDARRAETRARARAWRNFTKLRGTLIIGAGTKAMRIVSNVPLSAVLDALDGKVAKKQRAARRRRARRRG